GGGWGRWGGGGDRAIAVWDRRTAAASRVPPRVVVGRIKHPHCAAVMPLLVAERHSQCGRLVCFTLPARTRVYPSSAVQAAKSDISDLGWRGLGEGVR